MINLNKRRLQDQQSPIASGGNNTYPLMKKAVGTIFVPTAF